MQHACSGKGSAQGGGEQACDPSLSPFGLLLARAVSAAALTSCRRACIGGRETRRRRAHRPECSTSLRRCHCERKEGGAEAGRGRGQSFPARCLLLRDPPHSLTNVTAEQRFHDPMNCPEQHGTLAVNVAAKHSKAKAQSHTRKHIEEKAPKGTSSAGSAE